MLKSKSKLVLGTAQFGLDYGINNAHGKPSIQTITKIIDYALSNGVEFLDTAQAYGNSEEQIGVALKELKKSAKIITKLHPNLDPTNEKACFEAIVDSCKRCSQKQLWGLMLHRSEWLDQWHNGLGQALLKAKKEGLVSHLGISVYTPQQANQLFQFPELDIIQLPFNAWSSDFVNNSFLSEAADKSILCFFRSIYLQGALLMSQKAIKEKIPQASKIAKAWQKLCKHLNMSAQVLAMRYALSYHAPIVIGVDNLEQLKDNLVLLSQSPLNYEMIQEIQKTLHPFSTEKITNPALWS